MKTRLTLLALAAALAVGLAAPAQAGPSPEALLAQYQPVTVLDAGELFAPTSVEGFLADANMMLQGPGGSFETADPSPAQLPVHGDGWRLDHRGRD